MVWQNISVWLMSHGCQLRQKTNLYRNVMILSMRINLVWMRRCDETTQWRLSHAVRNSTENGTLPLRNLDVSLEFHLENLFFSESQQCSYLHWRASLLYPFDASTPPALWRTPLLQLYWDVTEHLPCHLSWRANQLQEGLSCSQFFHQEYRQSKRLIRIFFLKSQPL